ncbi:MAG: alpha/beta hydrolase [Oscillatoria sp. PMC 1051.18]|nr:alpha/beta hydrolase [Oscillatoria sp. PMC 1050.18]MEC5030004.1 alpha/beta hydrolase [Oscillatoria sp. PMC 1051.18]
MTKLPDALWINVSSTLEKFDRPLLKDLSRETIIGQWEYHQSQDEPTSLEVALVLLHDYLKVRQSPIHLLGHGTGGLLAMLYTRRYPERVKSLTLLSVGVYPAVDWQAHYYAHLQLLPCSREIILTQMVRNLFGYQAPSVSQMLVETLKRDLAFSLSPHNLFRRVNIAPSKVSVPLLVCGSKDDVVIDRQQFDEWQHWLGEKSRLWQCPSGRYFFHYFYPELVSEQIIDFWHSLNLADSLPGNLSQVELSS